MGPLIQEFGYLGTKRNMIYVVIGIEGMCQWWTSGSFLGLLFWKRSSDTASLLALGMQEF